GDGEVPELVQDDQHAEAEDDDDPAHATAPSTTRRACASARYRSSKLVSGCGSIVSSARSIISGIPLNERCPSRNACTATSFAAFMMQGAVPPAAAAWRANRRQGNASSSGASKLS